MNSLFLHLTPLLRLPSSSHQSLPCLNLHQQHKFTKYTNDTSFYTSSQLLRSSFTSYCSSNVVLSSIKATLPSNEEPVPVIHFEDVIEKDWSVLDSSSSDIMVEYNQKIDQIISAGEIVEDSAVLVSVGSEGFVDRLVDSSPCQHVFVVHDSLLVLAGIKEKHDTVRCWQGELLEVPEKWAPVDVIFLYFLPSLPFKLVHIFGAIAKRCSPGARVVISHPEGRKVLEQQREQYPDIVISDLPEKMTLEEAAAEHSFKLTAFVDEPGFYLAVLKFSKATN